MGSVLELQQASDPFGPLHPEQAPEVAPEFGVEDIGLAPTPAGLQYAGPHMYPIFIPFDVGDFLDDAFRSFRLLHKREQPTKPVKDGRIDVVRVAKTEENKQARDRHVLGLLTSLRAVFPGDVTEKIAREILPYAKYVVVPDELQLKQPTKEKRKGFCKKEKVYFDKKCTSYRKHQASYHRR